MSPEALSEAAPFPGQTAWSAVFGAAARTSPNWERHFERLVQAYWKPVFWYLTKRWARSREDALDLTQEFFLRLCEKDSLEGAAPEKGRFRAFLKLQLRNLVVDDLRRRAALKRGGAVRTFALPAEPSWKGLSPEEEFDRLWAAELLSQALHELEETLTAEGKDVMARAFVACCADEPPRSYRACADALGIKESDVRNHVHRARLRLKEILARRARETVANDRDAEDEVNDLLRILSR
ncbi:MAG TPA: sigma-70 family RNA polymerase sigma factor [Planctomycetota bacterium]